jgi:hypothetical protein
MREKELAEGSLITSPSHSFSTYSFTLKNRKKDSESIERKR